MIEIGEVMKEHKKWILLLFAMTMLLLLPMFLSKPLYGHDISYHLSNIEVLAKYLSWDLWKQGFHIIPEIANDLGYGIGIFYPMLPHLLGAFLYKIIAWFDLPSIISLYGLYTMIMFGSSILVYFISLEIQPEKRIAFCSAFLYSTMPYLWSNFFTRFSLNENFVFLFFPMVILGLLRLLKHDHRAFYLFFIIGYVGLLFSHLVLSMFLSLLLLPALIIYRKQVFQITCLKPLIIAILVVSILVLPDLILLLEHRLIGAYLVFQDHVMTSLGLVEAETIPLFHFIAKNANYDWVVAYFIPMTTIILFLCSTYYLYRHRKEHQHLCYFYCLTILTLWMTSSIFPWHLMPKVTWMIQFPWRLMTIAILPIAVLAPCCLLYGTRNHHLPWLVPTIIILSLVLNLSLFTGIQGRRYHLDRYYLPGNANQTLGHQTEYLPVLAQTNYMTREKHIIVLDGTATAEVLQNHGDQLQFTIQDTLGHVTIELPKLYYKGYLLTDEEGNHYPLTMSTSGYLETTIMHEGIYTLRYQGTGMYLFLRVIRLLVIISGSIYFLIKVGRMYRSIGNFNKKKIFCIKKG